jgi:hypothetical protein
MSVFCQFFLPKSILVITKYLYSYYVLLFSTHGCLIMVNLDPYVTLITYNIVNYLYNIKNKSHTTT